jgi:hypothetical protein
MGCPVRGAKDHPREVGSITSVFIESESIRFSRWRCEVLRARNILACNGKLRDMHVKYVHFEKWRANA